MTIPHAYRMHVQREFLISPAASDAEVRWTGRTRAAASTGIEAVAPYRVSSKGDPHEIIADRWPGCRCQDSCPRPVGLRHDGNSRNPSRRPAHFARPTHPQAAIRGATSFSCPRSSFAGKPRGTGDLVPVVGQRPARVLRQSRRARGFLGNIRAIFGLRGQGKCVRTSMDDTLSRHGRNGVGASIWRYAGSRTRAAVGSFRQRGPALPIRFSHGHLVWDQVAIRLLCIHCDVLRPISGSRRLESMDRGLFTMMLHEVEKRAISSTHCGRLGFR